MDTDSRVVSREILSYEEGRFFPCRRELVGEAFWSLTVDGDEKGKFSCSPWDLREVVLGYLYLNGMLQRAAELSQLDVQRDEGVIRVALKPGPPVSVQGEQPLLVAPEEILGLVSRLEASSGLFRRTGGVHSAALAHGGQLLIYKEDVSRHGAIERVAGACLEQNSSAQGTVLVFSGRVSREIVRMAGRMGCAMIVARSAPTDLACQAAERGSITLVGFARENRFNVYTCPHRVSQ